jgi:alkylhydroperoxidase/carboxymuconolactone decarboxylase family protein YurZ
MGLLFSAKEVILANIKVVQEREASGRVKEIYDDIKATMGWSFVPETFQLVAHNPVHLESYWAHYKQAMGPGKLDLKTKKIIAFLVSAMNNCGV